MILTKPSFEIIEHTPNPIQLIEKAGRTCYKSEEKITDKSANEFIKKIIKRGHLSVIEHASVSVRFIADRGFSHECVRHRLCAFSQESTRYCDYKDGVEFIIPLWVKIKPGNYGEKLLSHNDISINDLRWIETMLELEYQYTRLRKDGWSPQQARSVLPNSLKTEIVCTANFREWLHIFKLRTSKAAHPQMQEIMIPTQDEFKRRWPSVFVIGGIQ